MARPVLPEYLPDKCIGCDVLGEALTARENAIDTMGLSPSRGEINQAERIGNIARTMCQQAEVACPGLALGCVLKDQPRPES